MTPKNSMMPARTFFATPELVLTVYEHLLLRRDVLFLMRASQSLYRTLAPKIWNTLYGVKNLLALLCEGSRIECTETDGWITYQIPLAFTKHAHARFRSNALLIRHLHVYDVMRPIRWEGLAGLLRLGSRVAPNLKTIEIARAPGPARAVQDLAWVNFFVSPSMTTLKITSHSTTSMQLWTACDTHEALSTLHKHRVQLIELAIFPNRSVKGHVLYPAFEEAKLLIADFNALTALSLSVFQVDRDSLNLFGAMGLYSLLIQGFGQRPQNWANIAECTAVFARLTKLSIHNVHPVDVHELLKCRSLIDGLLSISLSLDCESIYHADACSCTKRLADSATNLQDVSIEIHAPVIVAYQPTLLTNLAGLQLNRLSVSGYPFPDTDYGALFGRWPKLSSLELADQMIFAADFAQFAPCSELEHLVVRTIISGPVPEFPVDGTRDLTVRGRFRLGRMDHDAILELKRGLLSAWRSVTLVNEQDPHPKVTPETREDRVNFGLLDLLLGAHSA